MEITIEGDKINISTNEKGDGSGDDGKNDGKDGNPTKWYLIILWIVYILNNLSLWLFDWMLLFYFRLGFSLEWFYFCNQGLGFWVRFKMFSYWLNQLVNHFSNCRLQVIWMQFSLFVVFSKLFIWFVNTNLKHKLHIASILGFSLDY